MIDRIALEEANSKNKRFESHPATGLLSPREGAQRGFSFLGYSQWRARTGSCTPNTNRFIPKANGLPTHASKHG